MIKNPVITTFSSHQIFLSLSNISLRRMNRQGERTSERQEDNQVSGKPKEDDSEYQNLPKPESGEGEKGL